MNFKALHFQKSPMLICNVWDANSARVAQKLNFQAIGTSSGAIASMLGYADGEEMSFQELEFVVQRIVKSVNIPLSVDLEGGYSRDPIKIAQHIMRLEDLGVVGVNIEDSVVTAGRKILNADAFSKTLEAICSVLVQQNRNIFVNVRTDTFLLKVPDPIKETITRAEKFRNAGGQGLFVPGIEHPEDIQSVVQNIENPLNVMCMPNLPDFTILEALGVHRISMGNFVYNKLNKVLDRELNNIVQEHSFKNLFA